MTIRTVSLSEEKACDLICVFKFFFFFLLSICCLATSVVWPNIWASVRFDSAQISKGDQMGLRTLSVSLESGEASGEQMKSSLLISGIAVPEKQMTWYYKGSLASDISGVQFFQYFPFEYPLKRGGKKSCLSLSIWVSLVDMGRSRLRSKADLTPRLCA